MMQLIGLDKFPEQLFQELEDAVGKQQQATVQQFQTFPLATIVAALHFGLDQSGTNIGTPEVHAARTHILAAIDRMMAELGAQDLDSAAIVDFLSGPVLLSLEASFASIVQTRFSRGFSNAFGPEALMRHMMFMATNLLLAWIGTMLWNQELVNPIAIVAERTAHLNFGVDFTLYFVFALLVSVIEYSKQTPKPTGPLWPDKPAVQPIVHAPRGRSPKRLKN